MGQFVSSNRNDKCNDELINTLIKREFLLSINVEKVFRSVDRGLYYTDNNMPNAYKDLPYQSGDIHLSSPSVYVTVIECLDLHEGNKFLNIGSGIGYISTLAGLFLGAKGVNHGIEINGSSINIAYQKLEEFKQKSAAIDYFEFCEPVFIEGNGCELSSVGYYDRVFCGASVPPAETSFMKALIKIGGILVMPLEGFLVKITRQDEYTFTKLEVIEVSFTGLVMPDKCSVTKVPKFPIVEPLSLQELCRLNIRASIRDSLIESNPGLQIRTKCVSIESYEKQFFNPNPLRQFVRIQYRPDSAARGIANLRDMVDTFAGLDEAVSDLGSTSENEVIDSDTDDDNDGDDDDDDDNDGDDDDDDDDDDGDDDDDDDDDDDEEEENASQQCESLHKKTESDAKRKSSEAGCSKENKTSPEKPENTKRMRMNTSSSTVENGLNSQFTNRGRRFWGSMSSDSSGSDDYGQLNQENVHHELRTDDFEEIFDSLHTVDDIHDSDTESDIARELVKYRFLNKREENELSKLLKGKIDKLPVPALLKKFLNYNKED